MIDQNEKINDMQARLVERQAEVMQGCIAACQAVAEEFRAQAKFWSEQKGMAAVIAAYEDCAEKLEDALEHQPLTVDQVVGNVNLSIVHEGQVLEVGGRHGIPSRTLRWPANPMGNFGCVQVPIEAAAEAEKAMDLASLVNAGVISMDESKAMAKREKFITGQWVVADDSDIVWRVGGIKTDMAFLESTEHPGWWCVLSKLRLASLAEILKTIQSNKAIIQAGGMVYGFGQPMHCKCDVQVNHDALTIQEKYRHLKELIRNYFEQLSNIYDFGRGSHDSFIKARQLSTQIVKILEETE